VSQSAQQKMQTLLKAKSYEEDRMQRGVTAQELAETLNIAPSTVSGIFSDAKECKIWGFYKLTPSRKRNVLWAYSETLAHPDPYDRKTKTVNPANPEGLVCENLKHHKFMELAFGEIKRNFPEFEQNELITWLADALDEKVARDKK
jgi:transcriptional regulator with XRE-family HTH domain